MEIQCEEIKSDTIEVQLRAVKPNKIISVVIAEKYEMCEVHLNKAKATQLRDELTRLIKQMQ